MTTLIDGTSGNDTLTGTAAQDLILGHAGNDRLNGLAGDDTLDGGAGTNQIDAGDGNDLILLDGTAFSTDVHVPAAGIDGGAGLDTIQLAGALADFHIVQVVGGSLQITDLTTGARTLAVNVEHLTFADTEIWLVPKNTPPAISGDLTGAVTEDTQLTAAGQLTVTDPDPGEAGFAAAEVAGIYGHLVVDAAGGWSYALANDTLAVQALAAGQVVQDVLTLHTLDGTAVQVTVDVTGTADTALLIGAQGDDRLTGSAGDDRIFGLGGADRIAGRVGNDVLTGGDGADHFLFASRFGTDRLADFDISQTGEVINLSSVNGLRGFGDLVAHHLSEVDGSAVITAGSATLTLVGVSVASLTADDFLF